MSKHGGDDPKKKAALGGKARAEALTPDERVAIARKGGLAKAMSKLPKATHEGPLKIGDLTIDCAVLEDGRRVVSERGFIKALGRANAGGQTYQRRGADQTPIYLALKCLKPFIPQDFSAPTIPYLPFGPTRQTGTAAFGVEAGLLPKICKVWVKAWQEDALRPDQIATAKRAEILHDGFSEVGIIALVDEATGYQNTRDREALQAILDRFLRHELAAWAKTFPDEFYQQIFRLRGWQWRGMSVNRPQVLAHYTKDLVYARLAPGILTELNNRLPIVDGKRAGKMHQLLTEDVGHPALAQHLHALIGFMRVSSTWSNFTGMVNVAFPKRGDTLSMPFMADPIPPRK